LILKKSRILRRASGELGIFTSGRDHDIKARLQAIPLENLADGVASVSGHGQAEAGLQAPRSSLRPGSMIIFCIKGYSLR